MVGLESGPPMVEKQYSKEHAIRADRIPQGKGDSGEYGSLIKSSKPRDDSPTEDLHDGKDEFMNNLYGELNTMQKKKKPGNK